MSEQKNQFGEPWSVQRGELRDASGMSMIDWDEGKWWDRRIRICECVSALAGIPDPAEFVQRAKELEAALEWALGALDIYDTYIEGDDAIPSDPFHVAAKAKARALLTPPAPPTPEQQEVAHE